MTRKTIWAEKISGVIVTQDDNGHIFIETSDVTPPLFRDRPYTDPSPYPFIEEAVSDAQELVGHILIVRGYTPAETARMGGYVKEE